MKHFIFNILVFISFSILMIGIVNIILVYKIENGKYFSINKNTQYVVFGHSHAECSFNDSLITNFENYGQYAHSVIGMAAGRRPDQRI